MPSEYLLAEWSEKPYTGVRKRHRRVDYKLVLIPYEFGADVVRRRREEDEEWTREKLWEVRNGRVDTTERNGVFSQ